MLLGFSYLLDQLVVVDHTPLVESTSLKALRPEAENPLGRCGCLL
jgi:hypothetical protein